MNGYVRAGGLYVDADLYQFIVDEAVPGSGVAEAAVWTGLESLVEQLAPRNAALLAARAKLQDEIDQWHRTHAFAPDEYKAHLTQIGYLRPQGAPFRITTTDVDQEISHIAGPQLIVPVMNERFALNAANARWGSLYDALYGTDALGSPPPAGPYDAQRGAKVVAWARGFLDDVVPLATGSHSNVTRYRVAGAALITESPLGESGLADPANLAGYLGEADAPSSIFLHHHGLHIELVIDRTSPIGRDDPAGIADVVMEAAVTTIMDCEDAVAAVDAADKVVVYRNWLGLMKGDLATEVTKGSNRFVRRLAEDRTITTPDGASATLPGRALMLVRIVGHHMTTSAVLDSSGNEVPEGLVDSLLVVLAAKHDLARGDQALNSRHSSIYVVKPKMHGAEEAAFANDTFDLVEDILDLPRHTVKIGVMDEERRTTLNLAECIRAVAGRIAFINTGFLDRTGDEIHTSMVAGAVVRKADMRSEPWLLAYENNNVDVGLACGFSGRAQIGKGMWAAPDAMEDMLREKIGHPQAGASCAWVPSPTAATLHATHYHRVDVAARQGELASATPRATDGLLAIPLAAKSAWNDDEILEELENNAQGILGYVVRWVDQGIGCSKVPDIHDVALMEDRATCRISSQHISNWLLHGVTDEKQVLEVLQRMAAVVDRQNANDPAYEPMGPSFDGPAFRAAYELATAGAQQPSGYTEPILHAHRLEHKAQIGLHGPSENAVH